MTHLTNAPPDIAFSTAIDDLYDEAANWLDGTPLENQAQADAVGKIMGGLRAIRKDADAARKVEKKPHDDAAKAVQDKWLPILTKADRGIEAAQRPLTDWLARQEAKRLAQETDARAEADRLAQEAATMARATLADAEAHDAALDAAKAADKAAGRIMRDKSHVAGEGRAIGLRMINVASLANGSLTIKWLITNRADELRDAILGLVRKEPLALQRTIPGVLITEEKRVA